MNKNTTDGSIEQVKGSVKEALGKVIGNERLEAEGATEKAAGKARKSVGEPLQKAGETAKKATR